MFVINRGEVVVVVGGLMKYIVIEDCEKRDMVGMIE